MILDIEKSALRLDTFNYINLLSSSRDSMSSTLCAESEIKYDFQLFTFSFFISMELSSSN